MRSEASDWGLIEVAWAISVDLEIVDFSFQRCRNRERRFLEDYEFKRQLRGLKFEHVYQLLQSPTEMAELTSFSGKPSVNQLAKAVLNSALKTLVVTELGWQNDIVDNQFKMLSSEYFPEHQSIEYIESPYANPDLIAHLESVLPGSNMGVQARKRDNG